MSGYEKMSGLDETSLVGIVREAIAQIMPDIAAMEHDTPLIGEGAVLDSVGFVTLLIAIEQQLEGRVDLASSFLEVGTVDEATNPFRTVGALARHLGVLMSRDGK